MKTQLMLFGVALITATTAMAGPCVVTDVTINGSAAGSCSGMFSGNVNSLEDVNAVSSTIFEQYDPIALSGNTFTLDEDVVGDLFTIAIKQATQWALFDFDVSSLTAIGGTWNGTWSTSGMQWDSNPNAGGCQGCGGISHAAVAYLLPGDPRENPVPEPASAALIGVGLAAMALRRKRAQ